MPFQIRHKETGDIVTMRSGKSVWQKSAHAKAAWVSSGIDHTDRRKYNYDPSGSQIGYGRESWKFDAQDQFELIEVQDQSEAAKTLRDALDLLRQARHALHDAAWALGDEIEDFLKENEQ